MISPERLRRYPFFAGLSENQLDSIALISEEKSGEINEVIFEEGQPANLLCLLAEGGVDLYYTSSQPPRTKEYKEAYVGSINPGEIFGVSALVEPFILNAFTRFSHKSTYISIDAVRLRALMNSDPALGYILLQHLTKAIIKRLFDTRVQLAAAWAENS